MNVVTAALFILFANALGDKDVKDPHSGCTDISYYDRVKYVDVPIVCQDKKLKKKCLPKKQEVCQDVTNTVCSTKAWAECKMEMESVPGTKCECYKGQFEEWGCINVTERVIHIKEQPICKDVKSVNCVTIWEDLPDGTKKWDGTEQCEDVFWKECNLELVEVPFNVTKTQCKPIGWIPYLNYRNITTVDSNMSMTCEVKKSIDCVPVPTRSCVSVDYQECFMVPDDVYTEKKIPKPTQEKVHQKKCIFPDPKSPNPSSIPYPSSVP